MTNSDSKRATSIRDINAKFSTENIDGSTERDQHLVSCGVSDNYNELEYIYDTYLKPRITLGLFTHQEALDALSKGCFDLSEFRERRAFYEFIERELNTGIFDTPLVTDLIK